MRNTLTDSLTADSRVHWVPTDRADADDGVTTQKYYAELIIPEDFTQKLSSAGSADKTQGRLLFRATDKKGMLASSMLFALSASIDTSINRKITETIVDNTVSKLQSLPDSMGQLSDGLGRMENGIVTLQQGLDQLIQGQTEFNGGIGRLSGGLGDTTFGAVTLKDSLAQLGALSSSFSGSLYDSAGNLGTLSTSSGDYKAGLAAFSANLTTYLAASGAQLQNSLTILGYLKGYIAAHPESSTDKNMQAIIAAMNSAGTNQGASSDPTAAAASLGAAIARLNGVYDKLNGGIHQLPAAMSKAASSAEALAGALGQVSDGSAALASGLTTAAEGAKTLNQNAGTLLSGEKQLKDGVTQLVSGAELLKSSVDGSRLELSGSAGALNGLGKFAAQPVALDSEKVAGAANTGTAMSPFILSLCLYIGGMMIMIILFGMENLRFKETRLTRRAKVDFGLFRYQLIGVCQAVLLAVSAHAVLGLAPQNTFGFYMICILGSLAFTTLIQVLVMLMKSLGQLLSLLLMMCQLTAGGGVLPTEFLPGFYKAIHPYMPMTYSVDALRNVILGVEPVNYHVSIAVLAGIALFFALVMLLISYIQNKKAPVQVLHAV